MIRIFISFIILLTSLSACGQSTSNKPSTVKPSPAKDGYEISVKVNGLPSNTTFLLTFAMGEQGNFYAQDTAISDKNGVAIFKKPSSLERGIYMVYVPSIGNYFEIIVSDNNYFSITTDTAGGFYKNMKITGSPENVQFVSYNQFLEEKRLDNISIQAQIEKLSAQNPSDKKIETLKEKRKANDLAVMDLRNNMMQEPSTNLLANVLRMMKDVEMPEAPTNLNEEDKRTWQYNYYKSHYWDNVNFAETGLIRAPGGILHTILDRFFDKVIPQDPDTLVKYVDIVISNAVNAKNKVLGKYLVQHLTRKYETSKVMCHDGVFSFLARKYYCRNRQGIAYADWLDSATLDKICEKGIKLSYTACKGPSLDLRTQDENGRFKHLHEEKGAFTVLFFWDPTCGHCKKVVPKINKLKNEFKDTIAVYAISTEGQYEEWKKYLSQHPEIQSWTNVCKTDTNDNWRANRFYYDIQANPVIFLLDKNKKIIAKKMDENKLEEFIVYQLGEYGMISNQEAQRRLTIIQNRNSAENNVETEE
jgi:thiol-disulfide isomerase/thioredoxin